MFGKRLSQYLGFQTVLQQCIAVLGILLAIGGYSNIYAAPEFSFGAQSQWVHLLCHLTIGIIVPPLLLWGVASLVLLVTKRATRPRWLSDARGAAAPRTPEVR